MSKLGKYCCFLCPSKDYSEKSLDDPCPRCGNKYAFPLKKYPKKIANYNIVKPLGRGFYSCTYLCEFGRLKRKFTLKVNPIEIYKFFKKDFERECELHGRIAQDTEHIVDIINYFDEKITFGNIQIDCHVAVLEYIDGVPFKKFIAETKEKSSLSIAQISIDLFRIWREFMNKSKHHNDLHEDNIIIQKLSADAKRAESIDGSVRAVAIDLGSVSGKSISDRCKMRLGDQHWLSRHLHSIVESLRHNTDELSDLDFRVASVLEERALILGTRATSQRAPSADECIKDIKDSVYQISYPWKERLRLSRFDDAYNALTLDPWFVPLLLVDPDEMWLKRIGTPGPQLITGMRGCGKTMLLRAFQFHARASFHEIDTKDTVIKRLKRDNYVGFFVSCIRLLSKPGGSRKQAIAPFERLYLAFCLEIIRAIRHLQELESEFLNPLFHEIIVDSILLALKNVDFLKSVGSDLELERKLISIISSLNKTKGKISMKSHPAEAFINLAEAVRKCSSLWMSSTVFFLLDDVSTRFLNEPMIKELFSSLIFQNPVCAFKLSTEAQTLGMALHTPGMIEKARVGRDYDVFDLGSEVHESTRRRGKNGGKSFIEDILNKRARYYPNHPPYSAMEILGDCSLKDIARNIVSSSSTSRERKSAYHGISALAAVCVGDIGDIISMYELILKKSQGKTLPIKPELQSECYQDFCSRRIYDLNRRDSTLKDYALGFAEASHELLLKSHIESKKKDPRLRQYYSVYVRMTTGKTESQFKQLRAMIDAGVFVLKGGIPRTKTRNGDPIQQFILTYRKLYGLSNFIGLSDRDRYELSGDALDKWLKRPEDGKEILLSNLGGPIDEEIYIELEKAPILRADGKEKEEITSKKKQQLPLFNKPHTLGDVFTPVKKERESKESKIFKKKIRIKAHNLTDLNSVNIKTLVIGLGFEERTIESLKRLLTTIDPQRVILVQYTDRGYGDEIKKLIKSKDSIIVDYDEIINKGLNVPNDLTLIDVTGLAKPALFYATRNALIKYRKVWICHTRAKEYYPLNSDIANVIKAEKKRNHYDLLDSMTEIMTGEEGPYTLKNLLYSDVDESRRRILCAFASAKHERLLSLLEERDFDRIELILPKKQTLRSHVAKIVAEIAVWNFRSAGMNEIGTDDLIEVANYISQLYFDWYIKRGFNFEVALTGSKIQAVACATLSVANKVSQCWYVKPKKFAPERFTKGLGKSKYFEITI